MKFPLLPKPQDYLFQHEETGLIQTIDGQQVEWGFAENNPRWKLIGGAFTEAQLCAYGAACTVAEREACTQACAAQRTPTQDEWDEAFNTGVAKCAEAIRARGDE